MAEAPAAGNPRPRLWSYAGVPSTPTAVLLGASIALVALMGVKVYANHRMPRSAPKECTPLAPVRQTQRSWGAATLPRLRTRMATCCPEDSEPYLAPPANYTPKGQVHVVTPAAGAPMRLYVVGPEGAAPPKAGVIVAHDIFGGDSGRHKQLCDTFAAAGYLVVMPDLFREAYDPDEKDLPMWKLPLYLPKAFPLVLARGWDNGVREDVQAAAAFLAARGVDRVGVIGFCYGAWVVMKACAGDVPQAACGVSVHPSVHNVAKFTPGGSETEAEAVVKGVRCPQLVLSSCSEPADWREGGAVQRWLQELPGPAGQCSELRDLPDTVRHGFCTRGDVRRPEVAAAVQEVVDGALQYFKTHLPL